LFHIEVPRNPGISTPSKFNSSPLKISHPKKESNLQSIHFSGAMLLLNIGGCNKKIGVVLFAQEGFWVGEKGFEKSQWAQGRGSPTV